MRFSRTLAAALFLSIPLLGAPIVLRAQEPAAPPPPAQPDTRADIPGTKAPAAPAIPLAFNAHFSGMWSGTLEYRDFSASSPDAPHTKLPTTLSMRPSPDGRAVNLEFTYDDGPDKSHPGAHKMVQEREILAFTADTAILTGTSNAQNQSFHVAGIEDFARSGYGTLVFTGPGRENDKPVDMQLTLVLEPGKFTWTKETRAAGAGDYAFRDQYTLVQQPGQAKSPVDAEGIKADFAKD